MAIARTSECALCKSSKPAHELQRSCSTLDTDDLTAPSKTVIHNIPGVLVSVQTSWSQKYQGWRKLATFSVFWLHKVMPNFWFDSIQFNIHVTRLIGWQGLLYHKLNPLEYVHVVSCTASQMHISHMCQAAHLFLPWSTSSDQSTSANLEGRHNCSASLRQFRTCPQLPLLIMLPHKPLHV